MINGYVIGDVEIAAKLRKVSSVVEDGVRQSISRIILRLQRKVMSEKLSGQVLKVRTGTLRRSVDQVVINDATAIVGIVSTNVGYGKAHEYGFSGSVPVKEHLRLVKQAFGKQLKAPVWSRVSAHSRTMNLPERSFLRSALGEMRPDIEQSINQAVKQATA